MQFIGYFAVMYVSHASYIRMETMFNTFVAILVAAAVLYLGCRMWTYAYLVMCSAIEAHEARQEFRARRHGH